MYWETAVYRHCYWSWTHSSDQDKKTSLPLYSSSWTRLHGWGALIMWEIVSLCEIVCGWMCSLRFNPFSPYLIRIGPGNLDYLVTDSVAVSRWVCGECTCMVVDYPWVRLDFVGKWEVGDELSEKTFPHGRLEAQHQELSLTEWRSSMKYRYLEL